MEVLDEPDEDTAHRLGVDALVAVEYENLPAESAAEGLDRLGLARACWPGWVCSELDVERSCDGDPALVCQRGYD